MLLGFSFGGGGPSTSLLKVRISPSPISFVANLFFFFFLFLEPFLVLAAANGYFFSHFPHDMLLCLIIDLGGFTLFGLKKKWFFSV